MSKGTGPSTVVALRIKTTTAAALDKVRGPLSRSAYIRRLIEKDVNRT